MRKLRKFRENTAAATSHEKEEDRKSRENIAAVQMQKNLVKT
jgi:hypothetical protein